MLKKIVALTAGMALFTALLSGCTMQEPGATQTAQTAQEAGTAAGEKTVEGMQLGFIISDPGGIFAEFIQNMQKICDEQGIVWTVKSAKTVTDKITAMENFTQTKMDVIILHVDDADALNPYVQSAQEAGIKVIAYDTDTETSDAFYGCQNYDYGYAIGKNAAEWVNDTFSPEETVKVAVCNYPSFNFLVERENGILAALKEIAPNTEVVATAEAGMRADGVNVGETWLQSNPDINVVVGINDDGVLGVYEAFNAAGYTGSKVGLFGGDAIQDACKAVKDGGIFKATVSTEMVKLAPDFVSLASELYLNGKAAEHDHYFPTIPVTAENVDEYLAQ